MTDANEMLDKIFTGAAAISTAAEREVKLIWSAIPFAQKLQFGFEGRKACKSANLGWLEALDYALDNRKWPALLEHIKRLPEASKCDLLRYGDEFAGAAKKHSRDYRTLAKYWPEDIATAEAARFLKSNGCLNLAELAEIAIAAAPKPPRPDASKPDASKNDGNKPPEIH